MNNPPTDDEFGTDNPYYERGRAWGCAMYAALFAHIANQTEDVIDEIMFEVDRLGSPLAENSTPANIRQFLAGAQRHVQVIVYRDNETDPPNNLKDKSA